MALYIVKSSILTTFSHKVVIKPKSDDGLILYSGKSDLGDFIAVYLNFGKCLKMNDCKKV